MQPKLFFLLLATTFSSAFSQEKNVGKKALFQQIATQDSGYLQKNDALLILSMANVIDSTDEYFEENVKDNEKYIKESDTIAKYFKMNNGNYLFLISYHLGGYSNDILIECSPQGKILNKEIYFMENCCWVKTPYDYFRKFGDFFSLKDCSCAMGGYYTNYLYLFKEFVYRDSINFIPLWCYATETGDYDDEGRIINWGCDGTIKKLENDSLIINYLPKGHIWGDEEDYDKILKTIEKESFDVLYIYKNNQWRIANNEDYEKINNTCFGDVTFYFRF